MPRKIIPQTRSAKQRLAKANAKRVRIGNAERRRFFAQVIGATMQPEEAQLAASRLVERVRAAKAAGFLREFRASI